MRKSNGDNQQFESHDVSDEALENISGGASSQALPTALKLSQEAKPSRASSAPSNNMAKDEIAKIIAAKQAAAAIEPAGSTDTTLSLLQAKAIASK